MEKGSLVTRKCSQHSLFGKSSKLPENMLPTNGDVGKYFMLLKGKKNAGNKKIYKDITYDVLKLWQKSSIPTVKYKAVEQKLTRLLDKGASLVRSKTSRKMINDYTNKLHKLFDICACKCKTKCHIHLNCDETCTEVNVDCKCPRSDKVSKDELPFLLDQRTVRKMYIGGVDVKTSKILTVRELRKKSTKQGEEETKSKTDIDQPTTSAYEEGLSSSDEDSKPAELVATGSDSDSEHERGQQMRIPLPNLAMQADRFGVSDRAAAALATATLIDVGMITKDDDRLVIDRSKVRRERQKVRQSMKEGKGGVITSIYFDGRKDRTLMKVKVNDRWYSDKKSEEHCVVLTEPGGEYLTHTIPSSSKATDIATSIMDVMNDRNITDDVVVIGCDSTNINTGCVGGVITCLENSLRRPLQRFICMLHTNELPLRHLFQQLDGGTSGATTFTGPIGKAVQLCENKAVVQFVAITDGETLPNLQQHVIDDLSDDQQYLYRIICAIRSGSVDVNLANIKPGSISHSRWLTLANRVCRLYVSTANPDKSLQLITQFIVVCYGPMWFAIKCNPYCINGPEHVFSTIKCVKQVSEESATIVKRYISRNAYFAHSENLLLAMLADSSRDKRQKAVHKILQSRKEASRNKVVRVFKVPSLNYDADDWTDVINWDEADICEPPLTHKLSNDEIRNFEEEPFKVPKYPLHTQSVERCIRLVTEAAASVYGLEARDGFVKVGIHARQRTRWTDTKMDLKSMINDDAESD